MSDVAGRLHARDAHERACREIHFDQEQLPKLLREQGIDLVDAFGGHLAFKFSLYEFFFHEDQGVTINDASDSRKFQAAF